MTEWQPRPINSGEEPALLDLLFEAYGAWPKAEIAVDPIDHLEWKLEEGHDDCRAVVVEADGRLVGGVVLTFREVMLRGRSALGASGGDVAVHPSYQGQGVFSAMTPFLLGVNMRADISYGYRSRNTAVQHALLPFHRQVFGNFLNVLVASTPSTAEPDATSEIRTVPAFDERTDALCRDAARQFDFIATRNAGYLNWRYCDRRAGEFTCLVAEESRHMLGYAIHRVSRGRGYLVDVLTLPNRLDVVLALALRSLADLRNAGVRDVECWLPMHHPYFDTLAQAGFTAVRTTQDITFRSLRIPGEELAFLREPDISVHFTLGDTDLV